MLKFEWHRDEKGYRLYGRNRIKSIGGAREPIGYMNREEEIILRFTKVETDDQALSFVHDYGLLTHDREERLDDILSWAAWFKFALEWYLKRGGRRVMTYEEESVAELLFRDNVEVDVIIDLDHEEPFKLWLEPRTLLDAMRLNFAQRMAGPGEIKTCKLCHEFFMTGIKNGPRQGAEFCCAKHQQQFNSLKRYGGQRQATKAKDAVRRRKLVKMTDRIVD